MRVVCVDDEKLILEDVVAMCKELPQIAKVKGFTRAGDALSWLADHEVDLVLLDIDMPGTNGIQLAAAIKEQSPDTAVIFLTGYTQYAVDAFAIHASGYLLKPVDKERLEEDVEFVLSNMSGRKSTKAVNPSHVMIKTFGNFDVQGRADQSHEGRVEVDGVVISDGQIHPQEPLHKTKGKGSHSQGPLRDPVSQTHPTRGAPRSLHM